jgi:hypothetical protein
LKKAKGAGSKPAEAAKSGPSKPSKPSDNKGKKPETRPKPGDPSKEKKRASSTEPSRSATARSGTAATRDSDGPACTEDACKLPEATPESPARKDEQIFGAESFKSAESSKPVEMTPEPRYGSPSGYSSPGYNDTSSATAERPWSGESERRNDPPMVPVVPNSFSVPDVGAGGTSQFSGTAWGGAKQVRRLPLAGQDAATAGETARDLADEAVPVYPVTQAK